MKAAGPVLTVGALLLSLVVCSTQAADEPDAATEVAALRAENSMLKRQRTDLLERLKTLEEETSRLRKLLKETGIDPEQKTEGEPTPVDEKEVVPLERGIAAVIRQYQEETEVVLGSQDTDIQKRTAWLEAARRLNNALGRGTILIEYEVGEVRFEADTNTALLTFSSARVEDFDFPQFYGMRISSDEKTALSIQKGSRVTLKGVASLGVDFSKPASDQPMLSALPEQTYRPTAYIPPPLGKLRYGTSYVLLVPYFSPVGLFVRRDCIVEVDGVRRALREVQVLPREERPKRSLPPPPVIRVQPGTVRSAK